jgi:hypothetical protein
MVVLTQDEADLTHFIQVIGNIHRAPLPVVQLKSSGPMETEIPVGQFHNESSRVIDFQATGNLDESTYSSIARWRICGLLSLESRIPEP